MSFGFGLAMPVGGGVPLAAAISGIFADGTQGAWYDPSDLTTLFQDSAGTTPVTAVEQPVGLMRDKSGRGNHAFQSTSASRPTYSRRINLLLNTEFAGAVAGAPGTVPTSWTSNSATGEIAASSSGVRFVTSSTRRTMSQTQTAPANAVYVFQATVNIAVSVVVRNFISSTSTTISSVAYSIDGVSVSDSTVPAVGLRTLTATITINATGGSTVFQIGAGVQANTTADITFLTASLVPANLASLPYQRVVTSTDYNADPTLFPAYLKADGTDDGMLTNSIDFTGTDKMFVSAGVRKLSDAARAVVVELGNAASAAIFRLEAPNSAAGNNYNFATGGTTLVAIAAATFTSPISNIVSGIGNISGDSAILRVNGTEATSSAADQGTGNFSNNPLYLFRRGGTTLPFNGWFYGSVIAGKTLTASQISAVERYLASKTMTVTVP